MTEGPITTAEPPAQNADAGTARPASLSAPGSIGSASPPDEALGLLDRAAKQGKLPGFERRGDHAFRALVYGEPFDRELLGEITPSDGGCTIALRLRLMKKFPVIAVALVSVSIWPGVWLTDSMIQTYFPGYPNAFWVTAAWYLPLTVIPLPWMLRSMWRKSEGIAREELGKTIGKIERALKAEPVRARATTTPKAL
ncbi:MAG: hypothetical protein H6813_03395 [Phycisphaeraceae bacterium]|nr:hypothetical protein [Phycisphaeraceae bacterium]MCB9846991.1 hypothetical protein [Phycisphaeraceae bacterium]